MTGLGLLGAVAPAAPAAAGLAIPILAGLTLAFFLAWMISRGLLAAWTHTLGYLLNWLARELDLSVHTIVGTIKLPIGAPFKAADRAVISALQSFVDNSDSAMGKMWHATASLTEWIIAETESFATSTAQALGRLEHLHLPKWAKTAVALAFPEAYIAKLVYDAIRKYGLHPGRLERVIEHNVTHTITRVVRYAPAIALPSPWAFPRFRHWAHDIAEWRHVTGKRLARLERLLAASGLALAVARMMGLPNWRCLTRGNIGRAARAFCGLDKALVDLLLLGTVEAFVASDLCSFTKLLTAATDEIVPALITLVDVENALVSCSGVSSLAGFGLPPLSLPAGTGSTLIAT